MKDGALLDVAVAGGVSSSFIRNDLSEPNIDEGRPLRSPACFDCGESGAVPPCSLSVKACLSWLGEEPGKEGSLDFFLRVLCGAFSDSSVMRDRGPNEGRRRMLDLDLRRAPSLGDMSDHGHEMAVCLCARRQSISAPENGAAVFKNFVDLRMAASLERETRDMEGLEQGQWNFTDSPLALEGGKSWRTVAELCSSREESEKLQG